MYKGKTIFLLPYPPPYAGPELVAYEILNSKVIIKRKDIIHINSNIRKSNSEKGKFNISGVVIFIKIYLSFILKIVYSNRVFIYLSSNKVGFFRDSVYIITCWLFRKICIAQYHGSNFDNFYLNQNDLYKWWIKYSIGKLHKLFVLGISIKKNFLHIYKSENITVLYNGIEVSKILRPIDIIKKPKDDIFVLFFMGHLWFPKGFYDLILAYKKLIINNNDIILYFAGEYKQRSPVITEFLNSEWKQYYLRNIDIIENTINDFINNAYKYNARYLGIITELTKESIFKTSDIFILPSYTEGFSMSCLEAMAKGLPVITTPVGAMSEIIKNGINGIITPVGDIKSLSNNILTLKNDFNLRKKISFNNIQYVKTKFNINTIASKLIKTIMD